jgi:hypothetical protein
MAQLVDGASPGHDQPVDLRVRACAVLHVDRVLDALA